jgi:hypothetical protein
MRTLLRLSCLLMLTLPVVATAERIDRGVLKASVGGRPLSVETFTYDRSPDSLIVRSELYQTIVSSQGVDTVRKQMTLALGAFDQELRVYRSAQQARGHTWTRAVVPHDSTLTLLREFDARGEGDVMTLPPGRLFVLEGGLFSQFDVMTRALAGKEFTTRPLTAITLGPRDSIITITVRDLGRDTLRWGGRPVQARQLEFSDGNVHYTVWADLDGRLLRLSQPDMRLEVERQAPALKPRAPRPRAH